MAVSSNEIATWVQKTHRESLREVAQLEKI